MVAYSAYQVSRRAKEVAEKSREIAETTVRNAELSAKADTFRLLRSGFSSFRSKLPKDFVEAETIPDAPEVRDAMFQYWYQSFDEWYITNKLNSLVLGELWTDYYKDAIAITCNSPAMVAALLAARERSTVRVDDEFCQAILALVPEETRRKAEALVPAWPPHRPETEVSEQTVESNEYVAQLAQNLVSQVAAAMTAESSLQRVPRSRKRRAPRR